MHEKSTLSSPSVGHRQNASYLSRKWAREVVAQQLEDVNMMYDAYLGSLEWGYVYPIRQAMCLYTFALWSSAQEECILKLSLGARVT